MWSNIPCIVCTERPGKLINIFADTLSLHTRWALLGACLVMYAVGLSMATKGGMYVLQMMDFYSSTFSALMVGMAEVSKLLNMSVYHTQ